MVTHSGDIGGDPVRRIFRAMKQDGSRPACGASATTLGVRDLDIPTAPDGTVTPNTGGMSATPDDEWELPVHRRPATLYGTGRHPVWWTEVAVKQAPLRYRVDSPHHGNVEPATAMPRNTYVAELWATAGKWVLL